MNETLKSLRKILLTMLLALFIGGIFIVCIGENPFAAYAALFRGAFSSKLSFGTTLASFTPLLLTSMAFVVAAKGGAFNVGVEGEVFLGGITAAYIGVNWTFLPKPVLYLACFAGAMLVSALWAWIPAALKAYYKVNEVCVTILMNTVALYITSYLVSGPMSAGVANAQSENVTVRLYQFMKPSSVNVGLFIAIVAVLLLMFALNLKLPKYFGTGLALFVAFLGGGSSIYNNLGSFTDVLKKIIPTCWCKIDNISNNPITGRVSFVYAYTFLFIAIIALIIIARFFMKRYIVEILPHD